MHGIGRGPDPSAARHGSRERTPPPYIRYCARLGLLRDRHRQGLTLAARFAETRPFADDLHFEVREWSWMAIRPHIAADLDNAISLLAAWTAEPSERRRRFASEASRPCGVWCAHLGALRQSSGTALRILEPLRANPALYVQGSVGNWVIDASKDQPDWVRSLCARWSAVSATYATARICKRALRSMDHKADIRKNRSHGALSGRTLFPETRMAGARPERRATVFPSHRLWHGRAVGLGRGRDRPG